MTFELLKAGLKLLAESDNNQAAAAKHAIAELSEVQSRLGQNNDLWSDECYVLAAWTVDNLLIETTFDAYDKRYAELEGIGHTVSLNDYENICRQMLGLEALPLSAVMLGFDLVSSLHKDNKELD